MRVLIAYPESLAGRAIAGTLAPRHQVAAPALDFRDQAAVERTFAELRPQALVFDTPYAGGIAYNVAHPADLLLDNLQAQAHGLAAAHRHGVERVLFLASSCMYPRQGAEAWGEQSLGQEPLEETNRAYATAKIAGWRLCRAFRAQHGARWTTVVPANLYGPGDDFDPASGHVIGALLHRFHAAREERRDEVVVWGSGRPVRDFLHVDDLAAFVALGVERDLPWSECNVGSGRGVTIAELAQAVAEVVGFAGGIAFDAGRPDGMARKVLDCSRAQSLGWQPRVALREGLVETYRSFLATLQGAPAS